jgi:hypothetical protein
MGSARGEPRPGKRPASIAHSAGKTLRQPRPVAAIPADRRHELEDGNSRTNPTGNARHGSRLVITWIDTPGSTKGPMDGKSRPL